MPFTFVFTDAAQRQLNQLEQNSALEKRVKAVKKTLGYLQTNPRHPGLQTHKYNSIDGPSGEEIFEAYCENRTPAAYRVFWYYGPEKSVITIVAITPHP